MIAQMNMNRNVNAIGTLAWTTCARAQHKIDFLVGASDIQFLSSSQKCNLAEQISFVIVAKRLVFNKVQHFNVSRLFIG